MRWGGSALKVPTFREDGWIFRARLLPAAAQPSATVDYPLAGNPVGDMPLAGARLFHRFQALEGLAEGDREAIIKVTDAMVVKHRTRQMVEEISS